MTCLLALRTVAASFLKTALLGRTGQMASGYRREAIRPNVMMRSLSLDRDDVSNAQCVGDMAVCRARARLP
jgi:hypothetical protein